MFTAKATGTEPLNYQWEWKPVMDDGKWQPCDVERFPGADSSTVAISSVQKSNEGSYRCVISNCAGEETSNPAELSVGKNIIRVFEVYVIPIFNCFFFLFVLFRFVFCFCVAEPPKIKSHLQDLIDAVPGKPVMFTAEATGTEPLNYQWEWKPAMDDGEWQPCDVERFPGADSSTLTIPSVQQSNEGSYRCVISNCAGSQTSHPAKLSIGKIFTSLFYYSMPIASINWLKLFSIAPTSCVCFVSTRS